MVEPHLESQGIWAHLDVSRHNVRRLENWGFRRNLADFDVAAETADS